MYSSYTLVVLIPCFNEGKTIGAVVAAFREQLPQAQIYVYDNNSDDDTAAQAAKAGAIVRQEPLQGKGNVVRRMFADIDSDIYVMVDGDSTYPADQVRALIDRLVLQQLDMVVGARVAGENAFRHYHGWGNRFFNAIIRRLFGKGVQDVFSGYRIFSRRFVKSFPALSRGFEIETELSVHALELNLSVAELPVPYEARPEGSFSKLHTFRDGFRILLTVLMLFKETRPFRLFSLLAFLLTLLAGILSYPIILTWLETGLVPRFPTAFIVVGLLVLAMVSFTSGIVLDGIAQLRRENKRLHYLKLSGPR